MACSWSPSAPTSSPSTSGTALPVGQTNISVSSRGTVRGIHFADVPPSQAKYVSAVAGSFLDFVVDIRIGSPTFGQWDSVLLDTVDRRAVYLSEGLGHAICALEDDSTVDVPVLRASTPPAASTASTRSTPSSALVFPTGVGPLLSDKDAAAPTLAQAREQGLLPSYDDCLALRAELAARA